MFLFYIDDSADGHFYTFSAIGIPASEWREVFESVSDFRHRLKEQYGIYLSKELHAWKFLSGRGRPSDRFLSKKVRAEIFTDALRFVGSLRPNSVIVFNVALQSHQDWAYERLVNRINRTMETLNSHALLISDEGKENVYIALTRKMRKYNPIPSRYGQWLDSGLNYKNIPTKRIIEDPVFKQSHRSTLIQLADFAAYALLRREVPTEASKEFGVSLAFDQLEPVCFKAANNKDPLGIIR